MAELPASPPRMTTTAAKPFDRLDPDRRAVVVGLLATLFLHLFLLLVAPHLLELELAEPSLFLGMSAGAEQRLAAAIAARL